MGCSMNVGVFWKTSEDFLTSVVLQLFLKYIANVANGLGQLRDVCSFEDVG